MLFNFFSTYKFSRFNQSGMYFDFFFKRITEIFTRNVLVYSAQFFAEKFMIEYWTKIVFSNSIFIFNKIFNIDRLGYKWFFIQLFAVFFYIIGLTNLILFI